MTAKLDIAFPEVALIRKGGAKKPGKSKSGQPIEVVGDDLQSKFRVVFYSGVDEKIIAAYFDLYKSFMPTRIRAMAPFRSVWAAFTTYNEAYNAGRMVAQADDEHYITLRNPLTGEYEIRGGEPFRAYTPGEAIRYDRNGQSFTLKLKPTNRLRLFLPEVGHLVAFTLKTTSFYDRENVRQQIGAIQAIADALNSGNAAGIPFYLYRSEREVTWNKPDGGALRVKKWLINLEADPEWVKAAIARMSSFAFTGQAFSGPVKPLELAAPLVAPDGVDGEEEDEEDEEIVEGEAKDAPAAASTFVPATPPSQPASVPASVQSPAPPSPTSAPASTLPPPAAPATPPQPTGAPRSDIAPTGPKDFTTFWSVSVPGLKVSRERALEAVKQAGDDAVVAYQILSGGGSSK